MDWSVGRKHAIEVLEKVAGRLERLLKRGNILEDDVLVVLEEFDLGLVVLSALILRSDALDQRMDLLI